MIRLKALLNEQPEVKESEYVDDNEIIKYKDADGKPAEMKAGSAKTMQKGHPAKVAWDQANEKGMKAAQGGDDDDKKGSQVSFKRTADDAASKSDDAASKSDDKGQKVVDGKMTVGDGDKKEEVGVEEIADTLDLPGIDAETLAKKFESGDATMDANDFGRISFSFNDDKLGYVNAEIEDDGTYFFDGDDLDIDEYDKEFLEDSLRGTLDYYHDQFKSEDEDPTDDDGEDDEEPTTDDDSRKRIAASFDDKGRPTKRTEYKGSLEYKFEDSAVEVDGETWDVYKVDQYGDEERDKQRELLPKSYTKGKFANQFGIMHPKKKLQQVASFLKKGLNNFNSVEDISDEDLEFVRNTFSFSSPSAGYNVSDNFGAGPKMKNISDERLRIGIINDLDLYADGKEMRVMMHIMEPDAVGRAEKKDTGKFKMFKDDGNPTYVGKAFVTRGELYHKEGDPLPQDEFPSKKEGMIKLKSLLKK